MNTPLVVRLPAGARGGERSQRTVQHVDVAATALAIAGLDADGLEGRSLLEKPDPPDEIMSHLDHLGIRFDSLTTPRWKVIRALGTVAGPAPIAIYDRDTDPMERHDRGAQRPTLAGYARQRLRRATARLRPGPAVDASVLARLRALGYVSE